MNEDYLCHYGVLGMKWGRRKQRPKSSTISSRRVEKKSEKQRIKEARKELKNPRKKTRIKDLSDKELQSKIDRLQMEKRYRDLKKNEVSAGRKLLGDILMTSGKTVGVQVVTYVAGKAVNKAFNDNNVVKLHKEDEKKKDKNKDKAA